LIASIYDHLLFFDRQAQAIEGKTILIQMSKPFAGSLNLSLPLAVPEGFQEEMLLSWEERP
jgi:hypothetical protein